jgi:hypothetical protein
VSESFRAVLDGVLFSPPTSERLDRAVLAMVLAVLLLVGCVHWFVFFKAGHMRFSIDDWPDKFQLLSASREAVRTGRIPYHTSFLVAPRGIPTDRFLANPQTILSPQIVLLRWLEPGPFVAVNAVLMGAVGFLGCLLIRARYRLSLLPFAFFYLLFSFNGHVVSHLAVGHAEWFGYFFLPFFALCVLRLLEGGAGPAIRIGLPLVLFAIVLQGAFHIYLWCAGFVLLLAAFERRIAQLALTAVAWSLLLSAFRIIPAAMSGLSQDTGERLFFAGYSTLAQFVSALISIRGWGFDPSSPNLGWWEYDLFISLLGLAATIYFGIYLGLLRQASQPLLALRWPMTICALMSFNLFYPFNLLSEVIGFVGPERVSSRFVIVPLLFALILAAVAMQGNIEMFRRSLAHTLLAVAALMEVGFELMMHSYAWWPRVLERKPTAELALPRSVYIIARPDPSYKFVLALSVAISAAGLLGLFIHGITKHRDRQVEGAS